MISTNNVYRQLTELEIDILQDNNNNSDNWENITVKDGFDPERIRNSTFLGKNQIGIITNKTLSYKHINLPAGIYNSMIDSSEIGNNCAIHNGKYIKGYVIESNVILLNIDEITVSENPLFGHGHIKKDGTRNYINIVNENGNRSILPFKGIQTADIYLWSKCRGNLALMNKFTEFTDNTETISQKNITTKKGIIGKNSVLRSCRIIRDVNFGENCRIFGTGNLENLTIVSSMEDPAFIGENSDLQNGIVGYGSTIRHGVKASNFILGNHANLKYGARFFDSYLAENSTVACCEVQSSLMFPFHEQHHNNSFLIASCLQGQSNIAAGSTIGSNHNSRGADGEICAGRGFWTALSSSLKHNCRFASFTLLAKNDFQYEMDIPLPFSLVSLNPNSNYLQIMPAYWFMYNMYALARNSWKFVNRDKRSNKNIIFENNYLAPDTIMEISHSMEILEEWLGKWYLEKTGLVSDRNEDIEKSELIKKGRKFIESENEVPKVLPIDAGLFEHSKTAVHILKPVEAYRTYKSMVIYYCIKVLCEYAEQSNSNSEKLFKLFENAEMDNWINIGGQLITQKDLDIMTNKVINNSIRNWQMLHDYYKELNNNYSYKKASHAYAVLKSIHRSKSINSNIWKKSLKEAKKTNNIILANTRQSRMKDSTNYFRNITFDNKEEGAAVLGKMEDDTFLKKAAAISHEFDNLINKYITKEGN